MFFFRNADLPVGGEAQNYSARTSIAVKFLIEDAAASRKTDFVSTASYRSDDIRIPYQGCHRDISKAMVVAQNGHDCFQNKENLVSSWLSYDMFNKKMRCVSISKPK